MKLGIVTPGLTLLPRAHAQWEETAGFADIVAIVQEVRPGVMFCVPMPPRQFWLNVNPNVLHVWEIRDDALTTQWREEARATHAGQRAGRFPGRPEQS